MDPIKHKKITGTSNELILDNLKKTSRTRKPIFIRIPLIPNFNDSFKNIEAMVNFIKTLGKNIVYINLLPYHNYGKWKYRRLQRTYALDGTKPPSNNDVNRIIRKMKTTGLKVKIGG